MWALAAGEDSLLVSQLPVVAEALEAGVFTPPSACIEMGLALVAWDYLIQVTAAPCRDDSYAHCSVV